MGWVRFDYTVVLASLVGAAVAIGNFAGICFVVQKLSLIHICTGLTVGAGATVKEGAKVFESVKEGVEVC